MSKAKLVAYVTKVDRKIFSSIFVDKAFIYIGKYKELITEAGVYNQICAHFHAKKKIDKFYTWLCDLYTITPTDDIPDEIVANWENKLILDTRNSVYGEVLRIERSSEEGYIFYAIKNKGNELRYLCHMEGNPSYMQQLKQFLKYNDICSDICDANGLEHPIEKSDVEIKKDIDRCLRYRLIPLIDEVKILTNNKDEYSLAYYDLRLGNKKNPTPAWDSFMETVPDDGSKECFMAYIHSIFRGDNFGKQMLWIHGIGDSGKSKVVQAVKKRLEMMNQGIVMALAPTIFQDKFTTVSHVKKRLIVAQDWADRSIIRNQLIKNITGNDDVTIRGMGSEAKNANVYSKLLVSSNFCPWVNPNRTEELSRMLYIGLDPEAIYEARTKWTSDKGNWAQMLIDEIDDFIAKCEDSYKERLALDRHNITIYDSMIKKLSTVTILGDNLNSWWKTCLQPFTPTEEKKSNLIYFEDLMEDYKRFLGKRLTYNGKSIGKSIGALMIPFLIEQGLTIHSLRNVFAGKYVLGYDWIVENKDKRFTLQKSLDEKAEMISKDGVPTGDVFAARKPEEIQGWKVGT